MKLQQLQQYVGTMIQHSASAAGNWLQLTLEHIENGRATISLEVRPEMANPYGNIHGGMMSLVIDEAIGWAVLSLESDNNYTSMSLNVDFLYAIKVGERLKATAEVVRAGKKVINMDCRVYNMEGRLLSKCSSNLIATGMTKKTIDTEK